MPRSRTQRAACGFLSVDSPLLVKNLVSSGVAMGMSMGWSARGNTCFSSWGWTIFFFSTSLWGGLAKSFKLMADRDNVQGSVRASNALARSLFECQKTEANVTKVKTHRFYLCLRTRLISSQLNCNDQTCHRQFLTNVKYL